MIPYQPARAVRRGRNVIKIGMQMALGLAFPIGKSPSIFASRSSRHDSTYPAMSRRMHAKVALMSPLFRLN